MINYEKIVQELKDWKGSIKSPYEQRLYSIEPHAVNAGTYHIFVIIKVTQIAHEKIHLGDRSQILTLSGLAKEIPDVEEKLKTLKDFLTAFTNIFFEKVQQVLDRQATRPNL